MMAATEIAQMEEEPTAAQRPQASGSADRPRTNEARLASPSSWTQAASSSSTESAAQAGKAKAKAQPDAAPADAALSRGSSSSPSSSSNSSSVSHDLFNQLVVEACIILEPSQAIVMGGGREKERERERKREKEREKRERERKREKECQMQLCFLARLEPTRMRWQEWSREYDKSEDKGRKCAGVQRCRVCVQLTTLPEIGLALRPS